MFYLMSRRLLTFIICLQVLTKLNFSQLITDPFEDPKQICLSIEIGYNVTEFVKLKDCTVIIGNLEIVGLIDFDKGFLRRLSFPKLREVTGYVLIFRVEGLMTLSRLFPNLTLIRGHELIDDYALIIYEVANLKEIGLRSLKTIERGRVRIERNYQVCFVETIDWKEISGRSGHRIETYTSCPGNIPCRACTNNACWNSRSCQSLEVCHQECLGCSHINKSMCHRCRHYTDENRCVTSCPNNKVVLEEANYCLTTKQCDSLFHGMKSFAWNNTCIRECPAAYHRIKLNGYWSCQPNSEANKMTCYGMRISILEELQKADNCQIIDGPIVLHITDNQITHSLLQKYLGKIEVIKHYLKIYSSPRIQTLRFLTNLRLINGQVLMMPHYSVLVYDMKNLKNLFKNEVVVQAGCKLYLHNDQLCNLTSDVRLLNCTVKESIGTSNETSNYDTFCGYKNIKIYQPFKIEDDSVEITFSSVVDTSDSNIKQYKLSYTKDDDENLRTEHRLYCDKRRWKVIQLTTNITDGQNITIPIMSFHKTTSYIFYIEYYSFPKSDLASPPIYGKSEIKRLTRDRKVAYLYSINSTTDSVRLAWRTVGNLPDHNAKYVIEMKFVDEDPKDIEKLNYCKMSKLKKSLRHKKEFHKTSTGLTFFNCDLRNEPNNGGEMGIVDLNDLFEIYMRNLLYNSNSYVISLVPEYNKMLNNKYIFIRDVTDKNYIILDKLINYGYYQITIQVCTDSYQICSQKSQDVVRMHSDPNLKKLSVDSTVNDHEISFYWNDPSHVSDAIVSYFIQITSSDNATRETILNSDFCVTRKDHEMNNYSYSFNAESDGDYRIFIKAVSLAGVSTNASSIFYVRSKVKQNHGYVALIWIFSTTLISLVILKGYCIWKSKQVAAVQDDGIALVTDFPRNSAGLGQCEYDADSLLNTNYM